MKKVFKFIHYLLIVFIVVTAGLLVLSTFPITGNIKFLIVQSGSMEPAMKTGSLAIIKPFDSYKVGDIICFNQTNKTKPPISHRIYEIREVNGEKIYITKGDANEEPDANEIRKQDIMGKNLFSIPYAGYGVDFAKKPIGFALIIIVPAGIIIIDQVKNIYKEIKKKKVNSVE